MGKHDKILYIGNLLLPDGDAASHRVLGNAKALRASGYEVSIMGCKDNCEHGLLEEKMKHEGFDCYFFERPSSMWQFFKFSESIGWIIPLIRHTRASVIIAYNYPAIALNKLRIYCHCKKIKIYSDCTEWYDFKGRSLMSYYKRWDTKRRMENIHLKLDGVMTISQFLYDYYSGKNVRAICVPPLVDKASLKWQKGNESDESSYDLCYVGNPGKGGKDKLNWIVHGLGKLSASSPNRGNVNLTIVGINKEDYERYFGKLTDEESQVVHFLGKLPNNAAIEVIKKSHYQIFLRDVNIATTAGFPTKFPESIACGTPVLTNRTSNISQYLQEGRNGYFLDVSTSQTLFESLQKVILASTSEKIAEMKQYCLNDNSFDYHNYIEIFKDFFDDEKSLD